MKIVLKNSHNENKVLECLAGDSIIYDLTTIWAIGRWNGSDPDGLDDIIKIQIPYNNILYIEDESFQYDELTIAEEMQALQRKSLTEIKKIPAAESVAHVGFGSGSGSKDVKKMIAQKKEEASARMALQRAQAEKERRAKETEIKEGKLSHPGRHRRPVSGIPMPKKEQSRLPFLLNSDKKDK